MVDRDKIEGLLRHLRRYTAYLHQIVEQDREKFLQDPRSIGSARYYLQVSIETCINITSHIIATDRLRAPKDYKDTFRVLSEAGILPDDFAQTMQELAGLRNLLVHLYWDVDDQMIYDGIRAELGDFDTFTGYIVAYLERTQ
jgi:uncharacterized protein YutE (UPF0331/DUF86 family)